MLEQVHGYLVFNNGFVIQYCKCISNGGLTTVSFPLTNNEIYWIGHCEVFNNSTTNGIWAREIWIQQYTMSTASVYLSGGYKFIFLGTNMQVSGEYILFPLNSISLSNSIFSFSIS